MVTVLFSLVIFVGIIALVGLAAGVAGADTRDGDDWFIHRHA